MSSGTVGVRHLKIHTIVGLLPHERVQKQDIFVSIEMTVDFSACYNNGMEDLNRSVDYATVAEDITTWIQRMEFELLESIAILGTKRILTLYPSVSSCTLVIEKPAAIETATAAWVQWTEKR